jgi:hypothetical protein
MKKLLLTIYVLLLIIILSTASQAQNDDRIRRIELKAFDQIQLQVNTEVFLVKGPRNQIILQGDSAAIESIQIAQEEGILALDYLEDVAGSLKRIIIEYRNIEQLTTGGNGQYFIPNLDQHHLYVLNPQATLYIQGQAENLSLVSFDGKNDIRGLSAGKKQVQKGELALVID